MQFDSLAAALEMAGHGSYVWSVALLTVAVIAWLLLAPVMASRRLLEQQRGAARRLDTNSRQPTQEEDRDASGT